MNDEREHDEELAARRFDWALREVMGREAAPDVVAAVLARAAAGDTGDDEAVPAGAPRTLSRARWLAFAALFLLGAMTVVGVALLRREGTGGGPVDEAQQGSGRILEVTNAAAIASLPSNLKAVELRNLDDAAVAALVARCPDLEHLRVFASTAYKRVGDAPAQSITDVALAAVARLHALRRLELQGTVLVQGPGLRQLDALPLLEALALQYFDVADENLQVLPRLPSLRELALDNNQVLASDGWDAIGRCPGLRKLSLRSTPGQATRRAFLHLQRLHLLESLDLSGINSSTRGVADDDTQRRFGLFTAPEPVPNGGIVAEILHGWPRLHTLSLSYSLELEPEVGRRLRERCPQLRDLDLSDCPNVDDTTIADVVGIATLRCLRIRDCLKVGEPSIALLAAAQQLRVIDFGTATHMTNTPSLTLAQAEQLLRSGKRVDWYPPPDRREGFAALQHRYAAAMALDRPELVRSLAEIEALPTETTHVECRGLGDRAAELLSHRAELRHIAFVRDEADAFTDKALAVLARLPKLESLELINLPRVSDAMQVVRAIPSLRSLDVVGVPLSDTALRAIAELPQLTTLALRGVRTFGEDGMRALGKCRSLRAVDLSKCEQLSRDAIAQLGTLLELESLQLAELPRLNDSALMGLQHLTKLRTLDISRGPFTSMGLQALAGMRELRVLKMSGNVELVPSALTSIPVGVEELKLDDCKGLDAPAAAVLRDRFPGLRVLGVAGSAWLDDDGLVTILQSAKLERLGIRGCPKLTVRSVEAIRNAKALRDLDATGTPFFTDEVAAELARQRPDLQLKYRIW